MNTKVNRLKKATMSLSGLSLLGLMWLTPAPVPVRAAADDFDPAAFYKAKCAMCHGLKADKRFDAAKGDEQHVKAILKGKDGTPKMPAFENTLSADQAKALVAHMKSLKQ